MTPQQRPRTIVGTKGLATGIALLLAIASNAAPAQTDTAGAETPEDASAADEPAQPRHLRFGATIEGF